MIRRRSFARAGVLGNPSDGYGGKTISLAFSEFSCTAEIRAARKLTIRPAPDERNEFESLDDFVQGIERLGLYGGIRLLKATLKRFHEYCRERHPLRQENFSIHYQTDIPRGVGLAGSSAIVTAALKALVDWFDLEIPPATLASLALGVERDVLGIPAGLQDRVIQMLGGVVYMDFSPEIIRGEAGLVEGRYECLPSTSPVNLYVAFNTAAGQPTEVPHHDLAERFRLGDRVVVEAMRQLGELAETGRSAWLAGDGPALSRMMDANFELRKSCCQIASAQLRMVETARAEGASAKFCGSGGAIIGSFDDDDQYERLAAALAAISCHVFRPTIAAAIG